MEQRAAGRIAIEKKRRRIVYGALGMTFLLVLLIGYNSFVTSPQERQEIRDISEGAKALAKDLDFEEQARLKYTAGSTALFCTAQNRHDAIERRIIEALLPGAAARDEESGTSLVPDLNEALDSIPPPTNCGELICQLLREVGSEQGTIEIKDPFGPNRKAAPCTEEA